MMGSSTKWLMIALHYWTQQQDSSQKSLWEFFFPSLPPKLAASEKGLSDLCWPLCEKVWEHWWDCRRKRTLEIGLWHQNKHFNKEVYQTHHLSLRTNQYDWQSLISSIPSNNFREHFYPFTTIGNLAEKNVLSTIAIFFPNCAALHDSVVTFLYHDVIPLYKHSPTAISDLRTENAFRRTAYCSH